MFTVNFMHPSTQRLYQALQVLLGVDNVGSTLAAKTLKVSSAQTINNWEDRGISKAGMVRASSQFGIRIAWLEREELPMIDPSWNANSKLYATPEDEVRPPLCSEESPSSGWVLHSNKIKEALSVLETALSQMDMQGRERIAPMFGSFARSPGPIIKDDIAMMFVSAANKSRSTQKTDFQKAG